MRKRLFVTLITLLAVGCPAPQPPPPPGPKPTATAPVPPPKPAEVVKSSLDGRRYMAFELDNGMKALVVSDPDTDMAAASLDVHVGHYADPDDRQGLAHFLEHMLFMGTKPFPDVDAYRQFVQDHGGRSNASTGAEHTSYFFEVQHDALAGALDRFSAFFTAPLLDPTQVAKERKAVHAEYRMKVKDAYRRGRQVRKVTTNPAHPEAKFSVGNLDTLADRPGKPVYEDLRKFYEQHYGPDRMTVSVIGREDPATLKKWITDRFSAVAGKPGNKASRPAPFTAEQLGVVVNLEPLRDESSLEVQWVLPTRQAMWPDRPHGYITHVLGHEGRGTLFAHLKAKGWIESLVAGFGDGADDYDLLTLEMDLTADGLAHQTDVVAAMFQYVRMMQSAPPEPHVHAEARRMSELSFRFLEERSPASLVQSATHALHYYPAQNVLNHWATWRDFSPAKVKALLSRMTVDNARVVVTSKGGKTDQLEPLYDVKWGMRKLTGEERKLYGGGAIPKDFAVPEKNVWLPEDVALTKDAAKSEPTLVVEEPSLEVWHRHDTEFGTPRGVVKLRFVTGSQNNLFDNVLGVLHARLLTDHLELWAYPAKVAGLSFGWSHATRGLNLTIRGYHDKQPEVLAALLDKLMTLPIDPARFALEKAELSRDWHNRRLARPYVQTTRALNTTLDPEDWFPEEAIATLDKLTPADLKAWRTKTFSSLWAQIFVYGNHTEANAKAIGKLVRERVLSKAKPGKPRDNRTRKLSDKQLLVELEVDHDDSSIAVAYVTDKPDLASEARYRMLGSLLKTAFFAELRSKQQLGYVVSAHFYHWDVLPGLRFVIQSSNTSPDVLLERIDTFIAERLEAITKMSDAEFATVRQGLIAQLLEADTQLYQRTSTLQRNLHYRRAWNHDAKLAAEVKNLTRDAMVATYKAALTGDDARRFIVRSVGRAHAVKDKADCKDTACAIKRLTREHKRPM